MVKRKESRMKKERPAAAQVQDHSAPRDMAPNS